MKKTALAIALAALILMLSACTASGAVYSRVQVGDRIDLTLKRLNGRFDQTLYAKAGDSINVTASDLTGTVRLTISLHNQDPIYDGTDLPESFAVNISEQGEYTLSLTGEGAGHFIFEVVHP